MKIKQLLINTGVSFLTIYQLTRSEIYPQYHKNLDENLKKLIEFVKEYPDEYKQQLGSDKDFYKKR